MTTTTAFLWVGNHPGLDFVNTTPVIDGTAVELLPDLDSLLSWCGEAGILRAGLTGRFAGLDGRVAAEIVQWTHDLRAVLRALLEAPDPPAHDYADLNRVLTGFTGSPVMTSQPRPHLDLLAEGPAEQLQLDLVRATTAALFELDPTRIRRCANPTCVLIFHDTSKGGQRRWCDMTLCGNRAKAIAHYRRRHRNPLTN
jgi:predicted RNA-binding Zn ribbon-like protein